MPVLEEVELMLSQLSTGEKAQILQWIAQDLSGAMPGIERTPGVVGGEPRIVRTRIPVWVLVQYRKLGMNDSELLACYPTLRAENLANAWAYYRSHRNEIDTQIIENESEGERSW